MCNGNIGPHTGKFRNKVGFFADADIMGTMRPTALQDVTGLVLAGGQGRRMGGRDKGLIPLAGRPLVAHVLDRLRPQVAAVAISANRHREEYGRYGCPVWADELPDRPGPLAGILTALGRIDTDWLLAVPVDAPALPSDLAERLLAAAVEDDAPAALAAVDGRREPAFCLVHRRLRDDLAGFLAAGERRLGGWLARHAAAIADFTDAGAFDNLNTPDDLQRFEARLEHAV